MGLGNKLTKEPVMVSHCPLSFTMVGDDVAVVCDHYLFRNISSLPQYALAGKLLTEPRARANNKPNPGHIHLESKCYHTTPP